MTTSPQIASHLLRSRIGKICVAITGNQPAEMIETAAEVLKETSFIEFRLDYLSAPAEALPLLKRFLDDHGGVTAIATCRCTDYGGRFAGSSQQAFDLLLQAAHAGFPLVDIELESIESLTSGKDKRDVIGEFRAAGSAVIISFHDFQGTRDLDAVYKRMEPFAPDFAKVVPTAISLADNVTLMRFLGRMEDSANGNVVGICMGEPGVISRVLGLRAGSAFTFAAAHVGEETAPGQVTARTLIETYRVEQVDSSTKVYGVAGDPISSSLSPLMMNTAFRRETVNAVYLALQTAKADDLFQLAREIPIQGLSVTMPLKQEVLSRLERTDPLSAKIGAVNTIMRMPDGKFYGFNTDVAGIVGPLERRTSLKGAKVLVLGAGGAARAAVFGCRDKGADVWILNRTSETAQKLARQAGAKTVKREAVAKTGFDIIINATPVGMNGVVGAPLLGPEDLTARIVFDLVYNPLETPLLQMARAKGLTAISGVEMFVQQGARQFEIWTGKPAPEEEMLRVVLHSLRPSPSRDDPPQGTALSALPIPSKVAAAPGQPAPAQPTVGKPASSPSAKKSTPPAKPATNPSAKHDSKSAPAEAAPVTATRGSTKPAVKVTVKATAKTAAKVPVRSAKSSGRTR